MSDYFTSAQAQWATFKGNELFVVQGQGGSRVVRFLIDASGTAVPNGTIDGLTPEYGRGITVNPATGELFVTDCCLKSIIRRFIFDASGGAIPNGTISGGALHNPHDLAFSPWGELFVANGLGSGLDSDGPRISRFVPTANGGFVANGVITGNGLTNALGVTFSPWGELFVSNGDDPNARYISRWTFDASHSAIANGTLPTPSEVVDLEFGNNSASFSGFAPRAEFWLGPKANDDSYWVRGWIKLANTSNGINPLTEAVTIKVGPFSYTIPAGSFVQDGSVYSFIGPVGPSMLDVRITPSSNPGGYSFKSCLKNGNLGATTMEPQVALTIGDDQGQATLDVGYAKFGTGADGQKWVFPPTK